MKVFAKTNIGNVRPINEDAYYVPAETERFCAVADGMGGHNAGEVASAMAIVNFAERLRKCEVPNAEDMRQAVEYANCEIFRRSDTSLQLRGMGTTFTALAYTGTDVYIAHVGDSRAYLIREGRISRITTDHSLVEEMIREGLLTEAEAKVHPKRNLITRAVGTTEYVEVDTIHMKRLPGDIFFLCTDGLSEYVEPQEILENALNAEIPWQEKPDELIKLALNAGGADNITAMYAIFEEDRA